MQLVCQWFSNSQTSALSCEINLTTLYPQAQTQLSSDQRYSIGPELDHYIDIINKNSMEVSHSSKPRFKQAILQLCDEVSACYIDTI